MKIVTVNVPESYIDAIEKLVGEGGLYPSRSELIRVAVREFLLKEMQMAKNMTKYEETEIDDFDNENFVRIPLDKAEPNKRNPANGFKTYKILRRLESSKESFESRNLSEDDKEEDEYSDEEIEKYFKLGNKRSKDHKKLTLEEKRKLFPNAVEYKFINEGRKGELLNIKI